MSTNKSTAISRRRLLQVGSGSVAAMLLEQTAPGLASGPTRKRPNFLWISAEDICPDLGCYGDSYARTPHIDEFASQGVRYTNVFANVGVCAPARSCIITGMYPTTIGTHQMRCQGVPPAYVKCFSEYLRAAGYYCTNNAKTDYQFDPPASAWDDCGKRGHWSTRAPGQPFFAVFNHEICHESQIRQGEKWYKDRLARISRHDPAEAKLPPYYPDTPVVRSDWAHYYDMVTLMDADAGELLAKLEKDGLAEDTIVWFWGDNGRGLPRAKRWIYDSGVHVPLIIRIPEQYRKLATPDRPDAMKPGSVCDELISFVDFAPTMLSLADIKVPAYMQGQPFLGRQRAKPRDYIFAHRDRMDERYDIIRGVRDKRFKYLRNYMPYVTYAQFIEFMDEMPTMREMRRLSAEGKLADAQTQYFQETKPLEELFDTSKDPYEINNLAWDPAHKDVLERLRQVHQNWMKETRDIGLIPEPEFDELKRPGGKWETTNTPKFALAQDGDALRLQCATEGASIVYRIEGRDEKSWSLYAEPVRLRRDEMITVKACRLGFRDSSELTYKMGQPLPATERMAHPAHWSVPLEHSDMLARVRAIKDFDYEGAEAIDDCVEALGDEYAPVRYWALKALQYNCATEEDRAQAKAAAHKLLADRSPAVRIAAAEALCDWGEQQEGLPVLVEMLKHKLDSTRLFAANALGQLGEKARPALTQLKESLNDSNGDVQKVAKRTIELLQLKE